MFNTGYEVPEIVEEKEFNEFLNGVFKEAVLEFNGACGKSVSKVKDGHQAVDMVINECKRVVEECHETIKAYHDKDRKERLDGVVDVFWTNTQLSHILTYFLANHKEPFIDRKSVV